ncbi:hypothetical protein [Streptomyces capoamus]|uniref:hypothetical protein n=1 Tax=Streptomyces capoamus TaxID=68183 RepID=UPI003390989F
MTRTAHHLAPSHGRGAHACPSGSPWRSVVLHDLRYSAHSLAAAAREATRPRPLLVRRAVEVYSFPRHRRDRSVARWAAVEERRARRRLRARAGLILRLVNSPGGELALDAAETVNVPPARHRRGALWHA